MFVNIQPRGSPFQNSGLSTYTVQLTSNLFTILLSVRLR